MFQCSICNHQEADRGALADLVNLGPCAAKAELAPVVLKDRLEVWSMHHVWTQRGLGSGVRDSAMCTTLNSGREPDITATPAHQDKVIINHCFLKKNKYFQEVEIQVQMLGRGQRAECHGSFLQQAELGYQSLAGSAMQSLTHVPCPSQDAHLI